jgi:hypothetical protein
MRRRSERLTGIRRSRSSPLRSAPACRCLVGHWPDASVGLDDRVALAQMESLGSLLGHALPALSAVRTALPPAFTVDADPP